MKNKKSKFEKLSDNTFSSKEMENLKGGDNGSLFGGTMDLVVTYIGKTGDSVVRYDGIPSSPSEWPHWL